ncbi:chitinase 6 isoform X1 [Anticarsia gemmatalis]|uniref:chitinase 6 isoform X1 n=1 Tax=Anticarsia gemmatalis TaxID=129554 RepID=UPI003F75AC1C
MGNFDRSRIYTIFKMDVTIWLSVLLAVITLGTPASSSEPRVVCYYTNWSVYRPGTARFNPQNINPYLCTHLIYAFGGFTKDNTLKPFDKYQDIEKGGYAKFTGLKTYNKNLKTLLAIGGWNEGSTRFSPMVASRERRKEFVRNAIKFLRQNRFDGLDLDWEYPAFRDGGKPKDRENYAKLVRELREEFDRESEKTGKPRLLLTMAVPAGIEYIQKGFDVKTLNQYLDWLNLLTYDYHSAFEPAVNHHAPLYPLEEPNEYSVDNELNIDYTIKFYLENGADANKLVLGIPTYGRSYTLFNADAVEIGSPADGPGDQGDATREKGYLAYYEICEALKPKEKKRRQTSDEDSDEYEEEEEEPWSVMHPNPDAMGPVAYKGNQWVGYDDMDIVKKKAEYVAENGLGGIMFWSIDNDDFRGSCHGKPYPLIEAAKEAYFQRLGTTDNAVAVKKPTAVTRAPGRRKSKPRSTTTTTTTTPKPTTKANKRTTSTTPSWNITPEPPTTPDPGSDFKCVDEGFYPHPRDCKKYFWCLDSGPSNLGIVAHQFTCPSGLYFNKAADSCDFARNVLCKKSTPTTKAPTTKAPTTKTTSTTTTTTTTTTRRPIRLSTKSSSLFRTTSTTTTTPEPETEEEYEDETAEVSGDEDEAEDPRVIKELIDLIKKVGGIEQLEKQLFGDTSASTDGAITTTASPISKKLYQKVLERTRGKNKYTGNSIFSSAALNRGRGPQNEGIEPTNDRDKLLRRDRPQYTTINRQRSSSTTEAALESEEYEGEEEEEPVVAKAKSVETRPSVATTAKPLQYVNIRRGRPSTSGTSDTADDTASRNALFERTEPVSVSDTPNSLDVQSLRRENVPEYVTIRRQRPTTEETTTVQYEGVQEEVELQETALEREISTQPQYNTIVRSRSTLPPEEPSTEAPIIRVRSTTLPTETPSSPDPTTVLAVQISSLLNSASSSEIESPETEAPAPTTEPEPTTTTTTTTLRPALPPRRTNIIRRRGSTTTAAPTVPSSTVSQVSPRNYTFVNRRRPLRRPNEISSDSDDSADVSRKIRSTTPDSREVDGVTETGPRRFRSRFQTSQARSDDSLPAAASPVVDEVISLTPIDVEPQFVPRQSFASRTERRFRRPTTSAAAASAPSDSVPDSDVSAATLETRRPNLLPRGRNRFTISSTTEATVPSATTSPAAQRRPTFGRFSPRPFTRPSPSPAANDDDEEITEAPVTQRIQPRLPFGRTRPPVARKLPFPSRQSTTQQTLTSEDDNNDDEDDDEPEVRADDILLSESAREEQEHDQVEPEEEAAPKRRIVIKKLRAPSNTDGDVISTETVPIDDSGKKRFRVIRRRPSSTTTLEPVVSTEAPTAPGPQRIRKIIRKKIKPVEDEPEITAKSIGSLNNKGTTVEVFNYGEKTRPPPTTTTEAETEPIIEEVTEFYKEEKKVKAQEVEQPKVEVTEEVITEKIIEPVEVKQVEQLSVETTTAPAIIETDSNTQTENTESKSETVTEAKAETISETTTNNEESEPKPTEESKQSTVVSEGEAKSESDSNAQTESKVEVAITTEEKAVDISENKETSESESPVTETEEPPTETTTVSTTIQTSPSSRTRLPYRPRKKLFTPSTEPSVPSSSKTFSRKFNPGAYTSPASADRPSFRPSGAVTRRPFSSKIFTRKPFTPRTTQRVEDDEEYNDEEVLEEGEEPEQDNPFVFVPAGQLFTRKPDSEEDEDAANSEELLEEGEGEENDEEGDEEPSKFALTTKRPGFKPRVVNSNTFRTSTTTTELPKRFGGSQNRTGIITRFGSNRPIVDNKKRVVNVPPGYNSPVNAPKPKGGLSTKQSETTTTASVTENDGTTIDDDYLTETTPLIDGKETTTTDDGSTTNTIETETATVEMEIDNSTDDYLEYTEGTTNYPTTQDVIYTNGPEPEYKTTFVPGIVYNTAFNTDTTTEELTTTTTTTVAPPAPIIKTQFNKLFSISRVVEVNSKLDKHRVNKNNETTHIEEGKLVVEKKPVVDKIGEVSRFSLIKIVEDEIPIYLTKLGHVYPVEHPPENIIRIDEARNARALNENAPDVPRENLVASESVNEAYRHVKQSPDSKDHETKGHIEHLPNDEFLTYINDDKKNDKDDGPLYAQWQFVPAAYENEKVRAAKSFEIVTPRSMLTNPSTLPLEGLFKTENPLMARKVSDEKTQPFVVYSASVPKQEEGNVARLSVAKPETARSIITFAKGQEFQGASPLDEVINKYPINVSVQPQSEISSTVSIISTTAAPVSTTFSTTTADNPSSPIIDLLSTTQSTHETSSTATTEAATTETTPEEPTTVKASPLDAKRAKFAFPRRQILKSSNFTRPSVAPRTVKKINATVVSNSNQKFNKTSFSPSKSRFSANRVQNVPVDVKKKNNGKVTPKIFTTTRSYTTESPKTTTERKIYFKPIRPNYRPGFIRKTTPATTTDT